jgi:hypothetical protein
MATSVNNEFCLKNLITFSSIFRVEGYNLMKPITYPVTLNPEQGIFHIGSSAGITCLGFDVCHERSQRMAAWLGVEAPGEDLRGTIEGYNAFRELLEACRDMWDLTGERCLVELTPQLIGLEGARVEVVDKWGEKRRFRVGRSTGWVPIHIELHNSRSTGGPAVTGAPFKSVRVV